MLLVAGNSVEWRGSCEGMSILRSSYAWAVCHLIHWNGTLCCGFHCGSTCEYSFICYLWNIQIIIFKHMFITLKYLFIPEDGSLNRCEAIGGLVCTSPKSDYQYYTSTSSYTSCHICGTGLRCMTIADKQICIILTLNLLYKH